MNFTQDDLITALVTPASMIEPERVEWLWSYKGHGIIPLGTGTVFAGYGGEGKTTFVIDLIAQLTRGELEGDLHGTSYPAILFTPEDDWAFVNVPRLMAAQADLDKVFQLQRQQGSGSDSIVQELRFPTDTGLLEQIIIETGAKVVLLDPATQMMGNLDMNKVQDVRQAFAPMLEMAARHRVAIIMITHFNKGGAGRTQHKVSGSHAWRDVNRSMLVMAVDEETGERVITQDKNNYGTGLGSWRFALETVQVPTVGNASAEVGRVRFLGESNTSVTELISREENGEDDDRNAAQAFVLDYLREQPGYEANAGEVIKAGRASGFSERQMKNARIRCRNPRIKSDRPKGKAGWVWAVDEDASVEPLKVSA